jgi:hypothetical protein
LRAATIRGLTQFVGREAELDELRRAQQLLDTGSGQLVAIIGEAGIGKSRLVYEFTHADRLLGLLGWLVLESTSIPRKSDQLLAGDRASQGLLWDQDRNELQEIRRRWSRKPSRSTKGWNRRFPRYWPCSMSPSMTKAGIRSINSASASQYRRRKGFLLREASKQPVLLIRGPPLGGQRNAGIARCPGERLGLGSPYAAFQLSPLLPARLREQGKLPSDPAKRVAGP